jgi:hypothetical protein
MQAECGCCANCKTAAITFPRIRVLGDKLAVLAFDEDELPVIVVYRISSTRD